MGRCKILIQHIGGNTRSRLTLCRDRPLMPPRGRQSLFAHETSHPFARDADALIAQFRMDARTALDLPIDMIDSLNALCQLLIFPLMLTQRTLLPGIVAAQ
jgi:hypothetical protein